MSNPQNVHEGYTFPDRPIKPRVTHRLSTADVVRFMFAAFVLGLTLGIAVPETWTATKNRLPTPAGT